MGQVVAVKILAKYAKRQKNLSEVYAKSDNTVFRVTYKEACGPYGTAGNVISVFSKKDPYKLVAVTEWIQESR